MPVCRVVAASWLWRHALRQKSPSASEFIFFERLIFPDGELADDNSAKPSCFVGRAKNVSWLKGVSESDLLHVEKFPIRDVILVAFYCRAVCGLGYYANTPSSHTCL